MSSRGARTFPSHVRAQPKRTRPICALRLAASVASFVSALWQRAHQSSEGASAEAEADVDF